MFRGIQQRSIVRDDTDRKAFLDRMGMLTKGSGTKVYAFALISLGKVLAFFKVFIFIYYTRIFTVIRGCCGCYCVV